MEAQHLLRLQGADNFTVWHRKVKAGLLSGSLIEFIHKDLGVIKAETISRHILSDPPLPAEQTRRAEALHKVNEKQNQAFSFIYNSLSESIQNRLPDELCDFAFPDPRSLYHWLRAEYSASSGARQAELWAEAWSTHIEENINPVPAATRIRAVLTEISTNAKEDRLSITEFIDRMTAYCILHALPPSFNSLAATLYPIGKESVSCDTIISQLDTTYRRRTRANLEVNAHGLVSAKVEKTAHVKDEARVGPDGNRLLGRDATAFCELHRRYGHTTANCKNGKKDKGKTWKPKAKAMAAMEEEGEFVLDAATPDDENHSANIARVSGQVALVSSACTTPVLVIDSGATDHFIRDKFLLSNIHTLAQPIHIELGDGKRVTASEKGDLRIGRIVLKDALHVPDLAYNLISVRRVVRNKGWTWRFTDQAGHLIGPDGKTRLEAGVNGSLYTVRTTSHSVNSQADLALLSWHDRCGHLNTAGIQRLGRSGRLGPGWEKGVDSSACIDCLQGKAKRRATGLGTTRATKPFEVISVDLWGPASTASRNGSRYMITCYDDFTSRITVGFLAFKHEAASAIQRIIQQGENRQGSTVKIVRSDAGGEFLSNNLKRWFESKGISHVVIPPTDHAQNGRVERAHLTLLNDVRTLLLSSQLPHSFWADAARYAAYTRNRTLRAGATESAEDMWQGRQVSLANLCAFGQAALYRVTEQQSKLQPRARKAVIIGYEDDASFYRLYDPVLRKAVISRDVTLLEAIGHSQTTLAPHGLTDNPVEGEPAVADGGQAGTPSNSLALERLPLPADDDASEVDDIEDDNLDAPEAEQLSGPQSDDPPPDGRFFGWERRVVHRGFQPMVNEQVDAAPGQRYPTRHSRRTQTALTAASLVQQLPATYAEALSAPDATHWIEAIQDELSKMDRYEVWTPVPASEVPRGQRALSGKWVFTRKIDGTTGQPSKYKARFVVRGFEQIKGRDYSEVFASVAHKDSVRVFLAMVNYLDMECDSVDIVGAFLNGDIDHTIHVRPPQGSTIPDGQVLRLRRSLYGLKQSPHLFNKALNQWLVEQGFQPTKADSCIYVLRQKELFMMISLHVDDQAIASTSRPALDDFKQRLNKRFECKDGGELSFFLQISIHRDRANRKLQLSQRHYVDKILVRFDMSDAAPAKTQFPSNFTPRAATPEEWEAAKHLDYPAMAGSILYLATISRPDIAYSASVLCRYISKWSTQHYRAGKHLLRYIRATADLSLTFDGGAGHRGLIGYADASHGGCQDTHRSTTGYLFEAYGGIVAWKSRRQACTTISTAHAETLASTDAARQVEWLRQLLSDMGYPQTGPTPIYNDNQAAITLSKHPHDFKTNKHFDIKTSYLREQREAGKLTLEYVPTALNRADLLTKTLPGPRVDFLSKQLRVLPPLTRRLDEGET